MKHIIIGTAGHIDHGKTTLIKALTGINTDRLKEEQKRGISIDLGFSHFDLSDTERIGIIDVPGHEKFLKKYARWCGRNGLCDADCCGRRGRDATDERAFGHIEPHRAQKRNGRHHKNR